MSGYFGKRQKGMHESSSSFKVMCFSQKNPASPAQMCSRAGINISTVRPSTTALGTLDYWLCGFSGWAADKNLDTGIDFLSIPGNLGEGYNLVPINSYSTTGGLNATSLRWELRGGTTIGLAVNGGSQNFGTTFDQIAVDGIAVGTANTSSFEFQWNINMLPPEFWIETRRHKRFRIKQVSLDVVPRGKIHPVEAISNPTQVASSTPELMANIPAAAVFDTLGPTLHTAAHAFSSFPTYTYAIPTPMSNYLLSLGIGHNWRRWAKLTGWEQDYGDMIVASGLQVLPSIIKVSEVALSRGNAVATKSDMHVVKHLLAPKSRMGYSSLGIAGPGATYGLNGRDVTAESDQQGQYPSVTTGATLADPRIVFDHWEPVGWIDIPAGGYFPIQQNLGITTGYNSTYGNAGQLIDNYMIPMGEFLVDTNEWPVPHGSDPRLTTAAPPPLISQIHPYQDFTNTQESTLNQTAPRLMNPPLFWDVTFCTEVEFSGENSMPLMDQAAVVGGIR